MSEIIEEVKDYIKDITSEIKELSMQLDTFSKNIEFIDSHDQMMIFQQIYQLQYLTKILTKLNKSDLSDEIDLNRYTKN